MEKATADRTVACTLDTEAWHGRLAWIADLNRAALIAARLEERSLVLTYRPDHAAPVREMVRRERQCCAFLSFDLKEATDAVTLVISVPEKVSDDIETILAPFMRAAAAEAGCGCSSALRAKGGDNVCG